MSRQYFVSFMESTFRLRRDMFGFDERQAFDESSGKWDVRSSTGFDVSHRMRDGMKMKYMTRFFERRGYSFHRAVEPSNIQELIRRLHPVHSGHELIRIGSDHDGGYLVPDDLVGIDTCFSPGVSSNSSFEQHLWENYSIGSHLADGSIVEPPSGYTPVSFTRKHIGACDTDDLISMNTWVRAFESENERKDLLLQMDIEGAEYSSILATSREVMNRFRIIIIEVHDVEYWALPPFLAIAREFFSVLLASHAVLHIHPNNCCGVANLSGILAPRVFEMTLLRRDRLLSANSRSDFPHRLDRANRSHRDDVLLPKNWYGKA